MAVLQSSELGKYSWPSNRNWQMTSSSAMRQHSFDRYEQLEQELERFYEQWPGWQMIWGLWVHPEFLNDADAIAVGLPLCQSFAKPFLYCIAARRSVVWWARYVGRFRNLDYLEHDAGLQFLTVLIVSAQCDCPKKAMSLPRKSTSWIRRSKIAWKRTIVRSNDPCLDSLSIVYCP